MQWLLEIIGDGIAFILGVIVMLIMGLGAIFNKAQMKRKDDESENGE